MKRFIYSIIFLVIIIGGGHLIIHLIYKQPQKFQETEKNIPNDTLSTKNDSIINILKL